MSLNYLSLGKFKIYGLRDGFFYLDGGAMFGVVPKVLWQKKYPADKENRIKLGLNSLLIDTGRSLVLVEKIRLLILRMMEGWHLILLERTNQRGIRL